MFIRLSFASVVALFNQRPDPPSKIKPSTQKLVLDLLPRFLLWQNGNLPSIVSFITGSTKKKWRKKKKKLLWRLKFNAFSSPACTSVSISRELKHGTAHTGIRPKRSKHASYHTYHSKNILNIKWVGKVSILTACTNFKNQGCTDLGPFFFSTSRSRGPAVISGFPSSCACN